MRMIISMRAISCNNWISNNDKELGASDVSEEGYRVYKKHESLHRVKLRES
jgi:hypothetical protein